MPAMKIRTRIRAGISEDHAAEVLNNPLYQGKGTEGSNPLFV